MKTAKMRDVDGGTYWIAFFDDADANGKRVSLAMGFGKTEKEAVDSLVTIEKAKVAAKLARKRRAA